jgi:hypothetical protein
LRDSLDRTTHHCSIYLRLLCMVRAWQTVPTAVPTLGLIADIARQAAISGYLHAGQTRLLREEYRNRDCLVISSIVHLRCRSATYCYYQPSKHTSEDVLLSVNALFTGAKKTRIQADYRREERHHQHNSVSCKIPRTIRAPRCKTTDLHGYQRQWYSSHQILNPTDYHGNLNKQTKAHRQVLRIRLRISLDRRQCRPWSLPEAGPRYRGS